MPHKSLCSSRFRPRFTFLAPLLLLLQSAQAPAETVVVRIPPGAVTSASLDSLLQGEGVTRRYCDPVRCVAVLTSPSQSSGLARLEAQGRVAVEPIPGARVVRFGSFRFDADTGAWSPAPPSSPLAAPSGDDRLFIAVFDTWPGDAFRRAASSAGLLPLEPLPEMGLLLYGSRAAAEALRARPFVAALAELPDGLRAAGIDLSAGAVRRNTSILAVALPGSEVRSTVASVTGREPAVAMTTGSLVLYSTRLTPAEALSLVRLPDVVSVGQREDVATLSDERSNRIIGGTFQTPGTSWPASGTLPANTPGYWQSWLSSLAASVPGFDLSNQKIGFLDTGVTNVAGACPPHLLDPTCRLVFRSDVCTEHFDLNKRARDPRGHGTLVTSVAAGGGTATDTQGYAGSIGVAKGARVAMAKVFFRSLNLGGCDTYQDTFYRVFLEGTEGAFSDSDMQKKVRYSLVELASSNLLPDQADPSPSITMFNHSWNIDQRLGVYDDNSALLDQTTRDASMAQFDFGTGPITANAGPILHIVSAGNQPSDTGDRTVSAPALAKNVLTVGASEGFNLLSYPDGSCMTGCGTWNTSERANDFRTVAGFSRIAPVPSEPAYRILKPELIAPGSRTYGAYSPDTAGGCHTLCTMFCSNDLYLSGARHSWSYGTSFATPAMTGAAAVVREWISRIGVAQPSPALIRAALVSAAVPLATTVPDRYQGFGGGALDTLFGFASSYFFHDQTVTYTDQTKELFSAVLAAAGEPTRPIVITLAFTDRASIPTDPFSPPALVNDLDLVVETVVGGSTYVWYGNVFSNGESIRNPSGKIALDRANTVEKVVIPRTGPNALPPGATTLTVKVPWDKLTGDAIDPRGATLVRQDFALMGIGVAKP